MRFRHLLGALCAAFSLCATAAIPASEQTTAVEFYNATLDHYFVTADAKEISDLDAGVHAGWTRTGYKFAVIKGGSTYAGTSPVCRFYSPTLDSHFYSAKPSECDDVKAKFSQTWQFESSEVYRAFLVDPATGICPADTTATYRLYNKRADVNHRYTDQLAVFVYMVNLGYQPEGDGSPATPIAFCTPSGGDAVPPATAAAPNCTVTASTGAPALGSTLALSATCTNNPTAFMWTGCTSSTSSCSSTKATAGQASYTLNAANAQGPADPVTINVTWGGGGAGGGGGGGGAVPICTVSADTISPLNGQTLTLTGNCNQTPTKYNWQECNYLVQSICTPIPACATSTTTCKVNSTIPGYARYTLNGTNSAGTGTNAVPVDVYWTGTTTTPPPTGGGGTPPPGGSDPIPVCSLLSSSLNPIAGKDSIVLSANCTGNPTQFYWTGVTCSQVQCQATSGTPGQVTYSVSGANATGTGGIAYVTVNWQSATGGAPSCILAPSNGSPTIGTSITIAATCTNSPTSYTWTGCSSTTASCSDSASVPGAKAYSLVATNAAGNSTPASTTVSWTAPPTSPPICSIGSSNASPAVGQSITLTATCTNSPTAYVWTNCTGTGATCTTTAATAGALTYYVAGVNQFGTGALAGVVVTWQPAGGGGGGGGGADFCGQYSNVVDLPVTWGDSGRKIISNFTAETVIVMSFTVPSSPAAYAGSGNTSMAEYQGPPNFRYMSLSTSRCDFRNPDPTGVSGPIEMVYGTAPLITWNVGNPPFSLVAGRTYYFNFRNDGCGQGSCNASTSTSWPH